MTFESRGYGDLQKLVEAGLAVYADAFRRLGRSVNALVAGFMQTRVVRTQAREAFRRGERLCGVETHSGFGVAAGKPCMFCRASL